RHERRRVTRKVGNRLRAFLGVSRYTLVELKRPITANHAGPSTAKTAEKSQIVSADGASSTANSSTAKAKAGPLRPSSSMVEEIGHEFLSQINIGMGSASSGGGFQNAPRPAKSASPIYAGKLQRLTQFLVCEFYKRADERVLGGSRQVFADVSFRDIECLALNAIVNPQGISMSDFRRCYNAAMRKVEHGVAEILRSREPVDDPRPVDL